MFLMMFSFATVVFTFVLQAVFGFIEVLEGGTNHHTKPIMRYLLLC